VVEKHLWLSAAAAEMLLWATKGSKEMGKGRKGAEAAAAALCHLLT
jgi:hypothetical protein